MTFDGLTGGSRRGVARSALCGAALFAGVALAGEAWAEPTEPAAKGASAVVSAAPSGAPRAPEVPRATLPGASPGDDGPSVRLHDRRVFAILKDSGGRSAEARAKAASQALERVVDEKDAEPRVEQSGEVAVVFVGSVPIVGLTPADAAAAGDASLGVHAASVSAKVKDALRTERRRNDLATGVFSFSLLVFSGLVALLVLRKVGELAARSHAFLTENPERVPAIRLQSIEVVRPTTLRGGLSIGLALARVLVQIGVLYGWLVFALSLFESTRSYTERLTGYVLSPLSGLMGRLGASLPLLVVTAIAATAVGVLVRFAALFFAGVARGETKLAWLSPDLAPPASVLVQSGIVIVAVVLAAPLVVGSDEGALARAGTAVLVALGLASTPLLASVAAGVPVVFGRRLLPGDFAEIGGRTGRVRSLTLLEVCLDDEDGAEVRVPHLLALVRPTRVLGRTPIVSFSVVVDPGAKPSRAREVLLDAARAEGTHPRVELVSLDADGACFRVTLSVAAHSSAAPAVALSEALERAGIALGRSSGRAGRA